MFPKLGTGHSGKLYRQPFQKSPASGKAEEGILMAILLTGRSVSLVPIIEVPLSGSGCLYVWSNHLEVPR
jgi:hypothetical protein